MNGELRRIMEQPDFRTRIMDRIWVTPNFGSPGEFDTFIRNQLREDADLVAFLEIKPE